MCLWSFPNIAKCNDKIFKKSVLYDDLIINKPIELFFYDSFFFRSNKIEIS